MVRIYYTCLLICIHICILFCFSSNDTVTHIRRLKSSAAALRGLYDTGYRTVDITLGVDHDVLLIIFSLNHQEIVVLMVSDIIVLVVDADCTCFGLGLFKTCHRTRSSVAIESSTEEWPSDAPPVWINVPRCSFTLSEPKSVTNLSWNLVERLTDPSMLADRALLLYAGTISRCPRIDDGSFEASWDHYPMHALPRLCRNL